MDTGSKKIAIEINKLSTKDREHVSAFLSRSPEVFKRLISTASELKTRSVEAETTLELAKKSIVKLEGEVKKLSVLAPSNQMAGDDGVKNVSQQILKLTGQNLVDTQVKILGARFLEVDTLLDSKLPSTLFCFRVADNAGDSVRIVGMREVFVDLVIKLKRNDKLNIKGRVAAINWAGKTYVIAADEIEKVK
ncbi:MAG: hypothetical protein GY880_20590 [Planctomycetaceae bacterium]|nr:hypothetical protein [Planctomycetaceae bacterium]